MKTSAAGGTPLDSAQRGTGPYVWRFNIFHRVTHGVVIVSFLLLVLTGIPLRFSCAVWSEPLMALLGGVEMAGLLHRIGAGMTIAYFGAHLFYLALVFARAEDRRSLVWGPDSMVPHPQDMRDLITQFRWYFGRGPRPRFGRFSYMEKFDYFAVFWGVVIIGGSGFLLWFPEFFGHWLPGWVFNIATVVHADEALLAACFIFTIHFFNVHLRPGKFPMDAVIFHGRATMDYMREEHPLQKTAHDGTQGTTLSASQEPDTVVPPPTRRESAVAIVLGFAALTLGILSIGMILWGAAFC